MANLYTAQTRAKATLNGGEAPPMTPVPARGVVDPAFTPGMGSLDADPAGRLRCPVVGCGRFTDNLSAHLRTHKDVLGRAPVSALRRVLDLPPSAPLGKGSARAKKAGQRQVSSRRGPARSPDLRPPHLTQGHRNIRNSCDQQLCKRWMAVRDKVSRDPGPKDAEHHDPRLVGAAWELGWTWDDLSTFVRLRVGLLKTQDQKRAAVASLVAAWSRENGREPTLADIRFPSTTPPLPSTAEMSASGWA